MSSCGVKLGFVDPLFECPSTQHKCPVALTLGSLSLSRFRGQLVNIVLPGSLCKFAPRDATSIVNARCSRTLFLSHPPYWDSQLATEIFDQISVRVLWITRWWSWTAGTRVHSRAHARRLACNFPCISITTPIHAGLPANVPCMYICIQMKAGLPAILQRLDYNAKEGFRDRLTPEK